MADSRKAEVTRQTKETQIKVSLILDGTGEGVISTGIPFMDHMLDLFSRHGFFDLSIDATGDIEIDYHHLVEEPLNLLYLIYFLLSSILKNFSHLSLIPQISEIHFQY